MEPAHNTTALLIGTGEFSFCEGATSKADAISKGYVDFGNIVAFTPAMTAESQEHIGSYRGVRRKDKEVATRSSIDYTLKCDEWSPLLLKMLFGGDMGTPATATQAALTETKADTITVAAPASGTRERWYDLVISGVRKRALTSILAFAGTPVAATTAETGDTFTSAGHGLANGDRVIVVTLTTTTGVALLTPYYVVEKATDTFKLAASAGGEALGLTGDGSATWLKVLTDTTDYVVDLTLGRIKFVSATGSAYVFMTADAITANSDTYVYGITPLASPIKEGYGRLIVYDQEDTNKVVLEHVDFSCQVKAESSAEVGTSFAEIQIKVSVTDTVGELLVRKGNL